MGASLIALAITASSSSSWSGVRPSRRTISYDVAAAEAPACSRSISAQSSSATRLAALDRRALLLEAVPGREPACGLVVPAVGADRGPAPGSDLLDQLLQHGRAVAAAPVLGVDLHPHPGQVQVVVVGGRHPPDGHGHPVDHSRRTAPRPRRPSRAGTGPGLAEQGRGVLPGRVDRPGGVHHVDVLEPAGRRRPARTGGSPWVQCHGPTTRPPPIKEAPINAGGCQRRPGGGLARLPSRRQTGRLSRVGSPRQGAAWAASGAALD